MHRFTAMGALAGLALAPGCNGPEADSDTGVADTETDADTDADTDSDSDTDTDSDTDSDSDHTDDPDTDAVDTDTDVPDSDTDAADTDTGGLDTDTDTDTGSEIVEAPDFLLEDVNPSSLTYGSPVSPRDYLEQVSGWAFVHAT